jgi:cysteine desulfurase / selenocysteine lyase
MLPAESLLSDFLILDQPINGQPLVYLDNAATTQKPMAVLLASRHYYEAINANIHRGTHQLARLATAEFEKARQTVASHLNAASSDEVIFTSGTTGGINLAATILGLSGKIGPGDEVLISTLEHHSNIVPWQMLCQRSGATLKVIPCHDDGTLDQDAFKSLLASGNVKILAITWISNAFGTVNPVAEMTRAAKAAGAIVLIDAAQAIAHLPWTSSLSVPTSSRFPATSLCAHRHRRALGPRRPAQRTSAMAGRRGDDQGSHLRTHDLQRPPLQIRGRHPNIEGAIALAAAIDYVNDIGIEAIHKHETELIRSAAEALAAIPGIRFYGPADRAGSLSFTIEGIHHYDLGTLLDQMGVAVRTGHHCCQPLMARFGITGTVRASFALYNTKKDVEALATATKKAVAMLRCLAWGFTFTLKISCG